VVSYPLLGRLAKLLWKHPEYVHISIEGHADSRGTEEYNQNLSERRAASVRAFLIRSGVEPGRLSSKGFGSTKPIVDKDSEDAWLLNRRVEFVVTRATKVSQKRAETAADSPVRLKPEEPEVPADSAAEKPPIPAPEEKRPEEGKP
jgi:OOP family OmpA-OmpF porin